VAASFVYDAFAQRFSKMDSGSTPILYSYLQDHRLMEENNNGAKTDYIYADGRPVSVLEIGAGPIPATDYILADRLGTPQLASSSSHGTIWSTTYQPYGTTGTITGTITQNLRLPGQNYDSETGFYYNVQRDYMPNIGRYLETDPIGLVGGLNTYLYVRGNPLVFVDTQGKQLAQVAQAAILLLIPAFDWYYDVLRYNADNEQAFGPSENNSPVMNEFSKSWALQ
jgi:RHS repeat-associated protein